MSHLLLLFFLLLLLLFGQAILGQIPSQGGDRLNCAHVIQVPARQASHESAQSDIISVAAGCTAIGQKLSDAISGGLALEPPWMHITT